MTPFTEFTGTRAEFAAYQRGLADADEPCYRHGLRIGVVTGLCWGVYLAAMLAWLSNWLGWL